MIETIDILISSSEGFWQEFEFGKIIGLLGLSAVRFFIAPSAIILAGYTFWQSIFLSCFGGISSFLIFYKFGRYISGFLNQILRRKGDFKITKRSRRVVKIKNKYGLYGVAILTPCIISIPLGAFLASTYFSNQKRTIPIFILAIVAWSFILTSISKFLI